MEIDAKRIGIILSELRGEKTQAEVAEGVGVSVSAMSMYENGERVPRDEIKVRIAKYYNKPIQEIFFAIE